MRILQIWLREITFFLIFVIRKLFFFIEGSNRKAFVVSPRHLKNHTSSPRHGHHSCSKSMIHLKTSCSSQLQLPSVAAARGGQDCIKNFDVADTKFDLSNRRKVKKREGGGGGCATYWNHTLKRSIVQIFSTIIFMVRRGNFVCLKLNCTQIYYPLSYLGSCAIKS